LIYFQTTFGSNKKTAVYHHGFQKNKKQIHQNYS
jgi:hypothetical protein